MKNLSLNAKIMIIMAILIVGNILIGGNGLKQMYDIENNLEDIAETLYPRISMAVEIRTAFRSMVIQEKNHILTPDTEKENYKKIEEDLAKAGQVYLAKWNELYAVASDEGKQKLKAIEANYKKWSENNQKVIRLSQENKKLEAYQINTGENGKLRQDVEDEVSAIIDLNQKRMQERVEESKEAYDIARVLTLVLSIVATLLGVIIAFFVLRAVNQSINSVINNLQDSSAQVSSAAEQISSSSEELSQSATEQASSLEETAASIEEISSMVHKNAENAKKAADIASSSHESATKGKEVVQSMISAIQEINASNNEISEIVKVIAEIGNKTRVINDIVFQTKLLSFNASVEAARAGEHGKGFAVVAEEVGNLAQMSGNAAKEISSMLEGSIQKVERLVATSRDKVDVGTKVAGQCGEVLDEIVYNVGSVTTMASEIAKASDEQSRGIGEITRAMSQLDQVTQQNAASSEETASSAEELSAQAEALRGVVRELIVAIKGGDQSAAVSARQERSSSSNSGPQGPRTGKRKVIHIKNATSARSATSNWQGDGQARKVVGMDSVPAGDDPRFEEV